MRKPKDLDQFCDLETAARGLEDFARDLRNNREGMFIKWSLSVRQWHPEWEDKPKRREDGST